MNNRGYSLLEVMISMVVLAVAFMAILATQFGTLKGYVSARDAQQAAELGRRTTELLRIQGSQWVYNVDHDSDVNTIDSFLTAAPYDDTEVTPFDETDPIEAIRTAPSWIPLVDVPVDARFNRDDPAISANHVGGKFCIYARGREMSTQFQQFGGGAVVAAMRFQVAIVYPGPRASLTDCTTTGPITNALLDAVGGYSASPTPLPPAMESSGFRVEYFGTVVVRRAHLTSYAGGG